MSEICVLKNNKGGEKLCVDGYSYYLQRKSKQGSYNWQCSSRIKNNCKCRVTTVMEKNEHCLKKITNSHCHSPSAAEKDIWQANIKVKELARGSCLSSSQIIRESVVATSTSSRDYLPSKVAQKAKIKRVRKAVPSRKEPSSLKKLTYP